MYFLLPIIERDAVANPDIFSRPMKLDLDLTESPLRDLLAPDRERIEERDAEREAVF